MFEAISNTFNIPDANLGLLQERIAKLSKKAVRLCGEAIVLTVVRTVDTAILNAWGKDTGEIRRHHVVTVTGPRPVINGWSLVAAIDLVSVDGEKLTIVRAVPGFSVPENLRNDGEGNCDHCGTSRPRKTVYICRHVEGSYKMVGSSCLADFLGHQNPEELVAALQATLDALDSASEFESFGGGGESRFDMTHYLGFVAAAIRADGWLSRTAARQMDMGAAATADQAFGVMIAVAKGRKDSVKPAYLPTEKDYARVDAALAFAETFLATHGEDNDYLHNLNVISKVGVVDYKTAGLAGSLLPTMEREIGLEVERRKFDDLNKNSKHFGAEGEKVYVKATVIACKEIEGNFGVTTMIRFATEDRNVAVWFASGSKGDEWKTGSEYLLAATVKKLDNYKGTLQTVLTRVVAVTPEIVAAEQAKAAKKAARAARKALETGPEV